MGKRAARSKPSPEPYVPSLEDGRVEDPCILCGDELRPWLAQWCELIGPDERVAGFAHASCIHEYQLFAAQMPFAAALQPPLF